MNDITPPPAGIGARVWGFFKKRYSSPINVLTLIIEIPAIIFGIFSMIFVINSPDNSDQPVGRTPFVAELFAKIAEIHSRPYGDGLGALKPSVQALANEQVSMAEINLSLADLRDLNFRRANLRKANLRSTKLNRADFREAILRGADLASANLSDADFRGAELRGAILNQAVLAGANLSGAKMSVAKGLRQNQLDRACADPENPPIKLPRDHVSGKRLIWRGGVC
jgi:hypothetical protein